MQWWVLQTTGNEDDPIAASMGVYVRATRTHTRGLERQNANVVRGSRDPTFGSVCLFHGGYGKTRPRNVIGNRVGVVRCIFGQIDSNRIREGVTVCRGNVDARNLMRGRTKPRETGLSFFCTNTNTFLHSIKRHA